MPTNYYVYAPVSGQITGLATYCDDGTTHPTALLVSPIDVDDQPESQSVLFHADTGVKSIRTTQYNCMCSCSCQSPYADGVKVEMFTAQNAGGTKIGEVFYLHLSSRVANGVYNTNSKTVGWVPSDTNCCYFGTHSHFERSSGGSTRADLYCYQSVGAGTTWVYRFTV